jgi:hypothetical protein
MVSHPHHTPQADANNGACVARPYAPMNRFSTYGDVKSLRVAA